MILFVLILIPVLLIARVPQQLGLWQTHPERLFDQTPDPTLGQRVTDELAAAGVATEGMTVWVFRDPDSNDRVVYALLDPADGFLFPPDIGGDPVLTLIGELGAASVAATPEISRLAMIRPSSEKTQAWTFVARMPSNSAKPPAVSRLMPASVPATPAPAALPGQGQVSEESAPARRPGACRGCAGARSGW